jgi:hypothetical protein
VAERAILGSTNHLVVSGFTEAIRIVFGRGCRQQDFNIGSNKISCGIQLFSNLLFAHARDGLHFFQENGAKDFVAPIRIVPQTLKSRLFNYLSHKGLDCL